MVDVPPARAAAAGDRCAQGVLQSTTFERRIDASLSDSASEIRGEDRTIARTHPRCSSSQRPTHASQTSAMSASAVMKASTTTRDSETDRRTQDTTGTKAATPANSRVIGSSHDIRARYLSHAFGIARVLRAGMVARMA